MKLKNLLLKYKFEIIIFLIALMFSWWLMFSSFSYKQGFMEISSKSWSDFASHIPLIRSFSLGNNFPPQYPLFSGPIIRYHFLFFALVGLLEKSGLRIDLALNIPSILGFSFLILMIYIFAKGFFKSKVVGILSIIFFLFNGSLEFIQLFSKNLPLKDIFTSVITSNKFLAFGPYDNNIVSAFWNLNIYTNQRHLALSFGSAILIIYLFSVKKINLNYKKSLFFGLIIAIMFLLNMAVFLMLDVVLFFIFLLIYKERKYLFFILLSSSLFSLPFYLLERSRDSISGISIHFGYLVANLNLLNFINYWIQNFGLHLLLITGAFILCDKEKRRFLLSVFFLFIIGNLFQFSPEVAANHKFFNFFMIFGVMYSAYFIYFLWKRSLLIRPFLVIIIFFLIFSGLIDFFPIFNDYKIPLADYPANKDILWIIKNTKPDSVFLNSNYLYTNSTLAGRKNFLGWPYFAWSQGYDTTDRDILRKKLFDTNDKLFFCGQTLKNKIDYIEYDNNLGNSDKIMLSNLINSNKNLIYKSKDGEYKIYSVSKICKNK